MRVLVGDIGGTHARLLLSEFKGNSYHDIAESSYASDKFSSITELLDLFLTEHNLTESIYAACIAVAGPVNAGMTSITNLPWDITENELSEVLKISRVKLLNDFIAAAYGLVELKDEDILPLYEPENTSNESKTPDITVVGAGTGFGAANLVWTGNEYMILPSEAGHVGFAPENEIQTKLLSWLQKKNSHVSLEMVLSGSGLVVIYNFIHEVLGVPESKEVKSDMLLKNPAQVISEYALLSNEQLCEQALDCFIDIYGAATGNIALHYFSSSEMYIAGGIAPKIKNKMKEKRFLDAFFNKGKMSDNLKKVSVKLILQEKMGLLGALGYAKKYFY